MQSTDVYIIHVCELVEYLEHRCFIYIRHMPTAKKVAKKTVKKAVKKVAKKVVKKVAKKAVKKVAKKR